MEKRLRQESSIPVQTRVSIVSLAELDLYWFREGHSIRTMSQLISWSLDLLREVLEANGKVPGEFDTVAKAHQYLQARGLYQRGMKERGIKKISTALRFESLREEGLDPRSVAPIQHNILHRKGSVEPLEGKVDSGYTTDDEWEKMQEKIKEENEKDMKKAKEDAIIAARKAGLIVNDPEEEEPAKRSQEEVRADFFKKQREEKALEEDEHGPIDKNSKSLNEAIGSFVKSVHVKGGMTDEEFEAKNKEIEDRDKARLELEKNTEISEENIVKEGE